MIRKFKDQSNKTQKIFLKAVLDFYIDKHNSLNPITYETYQIMFKDGVFIDLEIFDGYNELFNKLKELNIWKEPEIEIGTFCQYKNEFGLHIYGYYSGINKNGNEILSDEFGNYILELRGEKLKLKLKPLRGIPTYKGKQE